MESNVATDPLRSETAFSKACAYLKFNQRALWLAHAAGLGTTLMALGLLVVLWLFADLMVWRGRVPAARELSPKQLQQMEQFWEKLDLAERKDLLGDAGYDAEHNHRLCRLLGIGTSVINLNPRNAGRRWPLTPERRALRRHFPRALYRQRWHAESVFSRHKRRLGSALTARRPRAQRRETLLRVLTHNLMILRPTR